MFVGSSWLNNEFSMNFMDQVFFLRKFWKGYIKINLITFYAPGSRVTDSREWPASAETPQSGGGVQAPEPDPHAGALNRKWTRCSWLLMNVQVLSMFKIVVEHAGILHSKCMRR